MDDYDWWNVPQFGASLRLSESAEQFECFFVTHPWMYSELVAQLRWQRDRGWGTGSISHAWETVRYDLAAGRVQWSEASEAAKMPNEFRAYYARVIMAACPDLDGYLRLRQQDQEYVVDDITLRRLGVL